MNDLLKAESYKPGALLDLVMFAVGARNDAALSRILHVNNAMICRMRSRKSVIHAGILLAMHDASGKDLDELRRVAGIPKNVSFCTRQTKAPVESGEPCSNP